MNKFILTPFFLDQPAPALEALAAPDWVINKPNLPAGVVLQRVSALHKPLKKFISDTIGQGARPVSIAGDCLAPIGVLAGLQEAGLNPVLIWLDAHGDFNTPETTTSGFIGGMPLAMMVGRGDQTAVQAAGMKVLPERQVILTDARDLDPAEKVAVTRSNVKHVSNSAELLNALPTTGPLYVHFDVDLIDPGDAPAMGYPASGGPTAQALGNMFRALAATGRVVAVSLTPWDFTLDTDGRTQQLSMQLLHALIDEPLTA